MKKILSFILLTCLFMTTNIIANPKIKVDNNILYLYNNDIYINDTFKFNITLNDDWQKPTYEQAHEFAFNTNKPQIHFVSNNELEPNNVLVLSTGFEKLTPEAKTLKLDTLVEMIKSELPKIMPKTSNFGVTNSSALSYIPFRYFTFDLATDSGKIKAYMYIGVNKGNVYIFSALNVNKTNRHVISDVLKSVIIQ